MAASWAWLGEGIRMGHKQNSTWYKMQNGITQWEGGWGVWGWTKPSTYCFALWTELLM